MYTYIYTYTHTQTYIHIHMKDHHVLADHSWARKTLGPLNESACVDACLEHRKRKRKAHGHRLFCANGLRGHVTNFFGKEPVFERGVYFRFGACVRTQGLVQVQGLACRF